ncbi:MAG: YfcE family phosphodiesterase [Chloroflexi bacterium]|nr:YfcE family phosphodiesterase [Chloroflexota bacterium]
MSSSLIGVLSDTHNNTANTQAALDIFRARRVSQLVHCGDITSPLLLEQFHGFWVWLVKGNNDYDWLGMRSEARRLGNIQYMGKDAQLEFDGHKIAVCHGDDESLVNVLAYGGLFEWVLRGHSHRHELDQVGDTKILNPGALGGRHPYGEERCVAIVDLEGRDATFVTL